MCGFFLSTGTKKSGLCREVAVNGESTVIMSRVLDENETNKYLH